MAKKPNKAKEETVENTIITQEVVEEAESTEEVVSEAPTEPVEKVKKEIRIHGTNLNTLVSEVMYAAFLGGELVPRVLPRISSLPFTVRMLISEDKYEEYVTKSAQPRWTEGVEYNRVVVTAPDPLVFIRGIIAAGKRGAVLPPRKAVRVGGPYQAELAMRNPIAETPTVHVGPKKIAYTKEELEQYDIHDLKLIGATMSLTGRGKAALIKAILDKQKESEV